ncbi:ANTAR domain-containing protein [Streptomyces sp. NPDC005551]|uniref:ANTAR domain-containing protein n=1 Tax=unclassified Streptomyces TaxID=2593676 RepID=UPI0033EA8268
MSRTAMLPEGYWDLKAEASWTNAPPPRQSVAGLRAEIVRLRRALVGRAAVDQARGIVMVLTPCRRAAARNLLVEVSRECRVRLPETAAAVVAAWEGKQLPRPMQQALQRAVRDFHAEDRTCASGASDEATTGRRRV